MYFIVFITFLLISFVLLFAGYKDNNDILKVVAFFMLFVLGGIILNTGIEVKTGEEIINIDCDNVINNSIESYSYDVQNLTSITTSNTYMKVCTDSTYTNSTTIKNDVYESVTDKTFGYWMMIVAFFGWLSIYLQRKQINKEE